MASYDINLAVQAVLYFSDAMLRFTLNRIKSMPRSFKDMLHKHQHSQSNIMSNNWVIKVFWVCMGSPTSMQAADTVGQFVHAGFIMTFDGRFPFVQFI